MENASSITYDVAKTEYEKVFQASEKMDNKLNIAIAFCGVIFLTMIQMLDFSVVSFPIEDYFALFISASYCISVILAIVLYFFSLRLLIRLVNPTGYIIIDSDSIITEELYRETKENIEIYMTVKYCEATAINSSLSNTRAEKYKKAMSRVYTSVMFVVIAYFLRYNLI